MPGLSVTARALALTGLLASALAIAGCRTHPARPIDPQALSGVRHFETFTVYWVGQHFEGFRLTAADRPRDYEPPLGMRVYYGDCIRPKGLSSGGCTLPLEVNTVLYKPHKNDGLGGQRLTTIRGVPAVIFDHGKAIELYTGCLSIDVFADNPGRALRAARTLRPLNAVGPRVEGDLPAPQFPPGDPNFHAESCGQK